MSLRRLVFLGPPGAGKGTYARFLSPLLGVPHISVGQLLREEIAGESELAKDMRAFVSAGKLLPTPIISTVLGARLEKEDAASGFILDGFPRTASQVETLDELTAIDAALLLELPRDVLIQKVLARLECTGCGRGYNTAHVVSGDMDMPAMLPAVDGICDDCGSQLCERSDDTEETLAERLQTYEDETSGVIVEFASRGQLKRVDITRDLEAVGL
eukprot:PLAT12302.5.p1 GENE.PLAT12302.5~~PLAT12302.5.p1  ORF type:complete len:252 (-),score=10.05 PLAT12302.5:99-743(-)